MRVRGDKTDCDNTHIKCFAWFALLQLSNACTRVAPGDASVSGSSGVPRPLILINLGVSPQAQSGVQNEQGGGCHCAMRIVVATGGVVPRRFKDFI